MLTMETAIKKAIEGGYHSDIKNITRLDTENCLISGTYYIHFFEEEGQLFSCNTYQTLLDPLFWQALGKTEGWKGIRYWYEYTNEIEPWIHEWHRFIDHLAEGKDAESFFTNLLN
jgi:hypothetical protein